MIRPLIQSLWSQTTQIWVKWLRYSLVIWTIIGHVKWIVMLGCSDKNMVNILPDMASKDNSFLFQHCRFSFDPNLKLGLDVASCLITRYLVKLDTFDFLILIWCVWSWSHCNSLICSNWIVNLVCLKGPKRTRFWRKDQIYYSPVSFFILKFILCMFCLHLQLVHARFLLISIWCLFQYVLIKW